MEGKTVIGGCARRICAEDVPSRGKGYVCDPKRGVTARTFIYEKGRQDCYRIQQKEKDRIGTDQRKTKKQ